MTVFSLDPAAVPSGYGEAILSLANAKLHLRVDHDSEDELIEALRDASIDLVERYCGISLCERDFAWQGAAGCFASGKPVYLGMRPLTAITSISAIDSAAATVTATPADYSIGPHDRVQPKPGKNWPDAAGGATIEYSAGFAEGDASKKVPGLIQAVRLFLGHLYANREAVAMTGTSGEIPLGVTALCSRYRMPVL